MKGLERENVCSALLPIRRLRSRCLQYTSSHRSGSFFEMSSLASRIGGGAIRVPGGRHDDQAHSISQELNYQIDSTLLIFTKLGTNGASVIAERA
jgi:hypothetical protein